MSWRELKCQKENGLVKLWLAVDGSAERNGKFKTRIVGFYLLLLTFTIFGVKQSSYRSVRIYAPGEFLWNPGDTRPSSDFLPAKDDRREQAIDRPSAQSSCQRKLHVPAWIWFRVPDLSRTVRQPGGSAPSRDYAKTGEQRGGWALPRLHPRRGVASVEGLRLVAGTHALSRGERAEEQTSCETADERVYGLGASSAEEAGGPVSSSAQRWAQQDSGQTVAVGTESQLKLRSS